MIVQLLWGWKMTNNANKTGENRKRKRAAALYNDYDANEKSDEAK